MPKTKHHGQEDQGWAWFVMIGTFIWLFLMSGTSKSYGVLYMSLLENVGEPPAVTACGYMLKIVAAAIFSPVAGWVIDHCNPRPVVITGGLIASVSTIMIGQATTLWTRLCAMTMVGVASAFVFVPSLVMLGLYFKRRRALAAAIAFCGGSIGQVVLPGLLTWSLYTYGFAGTWLLLGGIWMHLLVAGALFRPLSYENDKVTTTEQYELKMFNNNDTTDADQENETKTQCMIRRISVTSGRTGHFRKFSEVVLSHLFLPEEVKKRPRFKFLKNGVFLRVQVVCLFASMAYFTYYLVIPPWAAELGIEKYRAASIVSVAGLAEIVSRPIIGFTIHHFRLNKYVVVTFTSLVACASGLCATFYPVYWTLMLFSGAFGVTGGFFLPMSVAMTVESVDRSEVGRATSLAPIFTSLAIAVAGPIAGLIKEQTGSYSHSVRAMMMVYFPTIVCLIWNYIVITQRQRAKEAKETKEVKEAEKSKCNGDALEPKVT